MLPNYQIIKPIYESANSLVYRALKKEDNQKVILKELKKDYPAPEELTHYRQEYDITRRLAELEGVINVYNLEKHQNTLLICLEDFGGESLKIWLDERRFTLDELLKLAIHATDILGQIHQQNIIHKDINPSNIVFNPNTGVLKIIDFGISTQLSRQLMTLKNPNVLKGTLAYMSPEQTGRMNRTLDYRTDFYSLGATFYELFTGVVPFDTNDPMELVHCHLAKQALPPIQVNPDIPTAISDIIMKLLEKMPEDRYQSAWGLKADLENCLNQTGQIQNFPLARFDISDRFQIPQKLYGREHEIETLLAAFERVTKGKAEMMLVAGYSGIGKSVLVKEIYKSLTEKNGYFITGKFDQFQRNIPYSAIVKAFEELVRQLLAESEAQLTEWKEQLLTALGANGQVIIDVIPEIELIIGPQPSIPTLGPTESQNRFNIVFQNFMRVFCQPAHPLVIFLDDLQWVDSASLKLVERVMTDKETNSLFLIGAYRDNEVNPSHPLMMTLDTLGNVTIEQITLKPLAFEHIQQLIADSLHSDVAPVGALTDLVMRKTEGNPFFVNQFLHTLYEENLLSFMPPAQLTNQLITEKGGWQWDIAQIEAIDITDNVVELMIGKLKKLPESAQHVLRLAACVGNHFDLDTLSVIHEKSASETFQNIIPVMMEGLILPTTALEISGDDFKIRHFQFLHDRVQQAAYALIDDEQKKAVHLKIGRLLLANTPAQGRTEKLFEIVDQLNIGIELIQASEEREQLAQLNLAAGIKAKSSTAYNAALNYLNNGIGLLKKDSWQQAHELTLKLHLEAAQAAYLNGQFDDMEQSANLVLEQKAATLLDKIKIYEVKIQAYMAQNRMLDAIDTARFALKLLGFKIPQNPNTLQILFSLFKTRLYLATKRNLIDLPETSEPMKSAAMRILLYSISSVYLAYPKLLPILMSKQIDLSLKYGHFTVSAGAYGAYGIILCGVLGDIKMAEKLAQLALDLLEKSPNQAIPGRTIYYINGFVNHWYQHLKHSLNPLQDAYQQCLEAGDLEYASYALLVYCCNAFYMGRELTRLEPEVASYNKSMQTLKQTTPLHYNQVIHQSILNLMAENKSCRLVGDAYNEEDMLPRHLKKGDRGAIFILFFQKAILCYLFQNYQKSVEYAEKSEEYIDGVTALIVVPVFYFYDSLARLAVFSYSLQPNRILKKVAANQKKLKKWARHAPMNHQHKFYLVEAERARVLGNNKEAREYYDKAIDLAQENDYINEQALAHELAGQFYMAKCLPKIAQVYLYDAYYAYQKWGAKAKVADLEKRYPPFFTQKVSHMESTLSVVSSSTQKTSDWLDLNSVMKASQTLSGEIVLNKLLEKMMHIVIENAGADKGFLLLPKQDKWFIEAQGQANSTEVKVLQSLAVETSDQVPTNIIQYVARTRENVVLHDATQEGTYQREPYIVKHRPKSILCAPLLNQGQLTGILYLENNLTTGAFTDERLEMLNVLSSQLAISIENSILYNHLEKKVAERTQELSDALEHLKAAQAQLVESEKMASLGGLVAGIAHEINTPLGVCVTVGSTLAAQIKKTATAYDNKQLKGSTLKAYFDSALRGSRLILNNLDRAAELVQSFKQVAVDQTHLDKRAFAVKKYIEGTLINLTPHLKKTQHQVTVNGDEQIKIDSYPGAFSQVITNLIMNSLQHAYQKGEVGDLRFSLKLESERLMIEYSDDGCGIPPAHLGKIFEPFFTTTRAQGGTGLGLHIVYNLVTQKLRGTIRAESEEGGGTRFFMNFPLKIK